MSDDLTNSQIALLCAIEEHEPSKSTRDEQSDLERLIARDYVQPKRNHTDASFELTAKGIAFLGERGAGLNEA
jgi:hypothetical protein